MIRTQYSVVLIVVSVAAHAQHVAAGPVNSVEIVAFEGQVVPGGAVIATLNAPFTNADGEVGFTGGLTPTDNFVWFDTGIIWRNSDGAPDVLTGAEGTMGVSNDGAFIYSPSVNGGDAVWGSSGAILVEGQAAPGFPGMFSSFNSRPQNTPNNVAHWVGGIAATVGGATQQRALYRRAPDTGGISIVLKTGDVVDGLIISSPSGIDFEYHFSDSVKHYIQVLDTTAATAADQIVYLDGAIALREGDPTVPAGEAWQAFDIAAVNNSGNWIVTGDTNGPTATDEFVAYNGEIKVREGDTLDGVLLGSGWTLRAASINNLNRVVHMWGLSTDEDLFVGDGPDLGASSQRVLGTGDLIDTNGDKVADATITDLEASGVIGPGLDLSDHDFVYLEAELTDNLTQTVFGAILKAPLPAGVEPCPADIDGNGGVNVDDLLAVINGWGSCPPSCPADVTGDGQVNVDDLLAVINGWGACP